ncbi:MAG TPA: isopentenyl phosphate kinase [Myxococcota bacterium]|nr:isopentenyl phosphate kinase [Myxococcota bacterium]HRY94588.1 isopentenyl phosphate kinase [Myxococcota bacterium]HSA20330.1 isopentenyl phosphate kinase [Myxococcota bacterium]
MGVSPAPERCLVKLGGSLITDKSRPYTLRAGVLERLAREIHQARLERPLALVLGHGGGSFPHVSASRYRTAEGAVDDRSWEGFLRVHADAALLNAQVCRALELGGERPFPLAPSAGATARAGRIERWDTRPLELLLQAGVLPVVYGDVLVDEAQGCAIASTEELFRWLARALRPTRVLLVGKVDGVLDGRGALLPEISQADLPRVRADLRPSDGAADVTGGMLHKVERTLETGVPTLILNGLVPDRLRLALLGEDVPGTRVH